MRIALIAHHVAPIAPPFVGGVESHTWYLARALARAGHDVTLFAMPGSSVPGVAIEPLGSHEAVASAGARRDVSSMPEPFLAAHHAYLQLMLELAHRDDFDAVHINTLHYLPVAMAASLPVRPLLTLHCPPTPWLESALCVAARSGALPVEVVAVSSALAAAWAHVLPEIGVIPNGIDLDGWQPGPGAPANAPLAAAWVGRIVPEKAPHLAIDAARQAGFGLRLAGPIIDASYFEREIAPRLGDDVQHVGHRNHRELGQLLGSVAVAIQSPAWDEPFGLVAAEAMACGTPVAAFARGGLVDVVHPRAGALAVPGDVGSLAAAITRAASLDRAAVRADAELRLGMLPMRAAYERALLALTDAGRRRPGVARLRERLPALSHALAPAVQHRGQVPQLLLEGPSS